MEVLTAQAAEVLRKIKYATLATVTDTGEPWNTPVAHWLDPELNFYWASDQQNQHSKNIRGLGKVFIVVYDSTAPDGEGFGVYLNCEVQELTTVEDVVAARSQDGDDSEDGFNFTGGAIRRVYKATPQQVWVNDAEEKDGEFLRDFRIELNLSELAAAYQDL